MANKIVNGLKEAGMLLMGIVILLAMVVTVISGVMNYADWLKWLNIF